MSAPSNWLAYLNALKQPFVKLCKLDFLNEDGSVAFSIDNNPQNKRAGAFVQDGSISVNLQNGIRRQANVVLSNIDNEYDFNINKVWFGQQIRLQEGLILPDGTEYYIPQGVFYVKDPEETFMPNQKTASYNLVDKWAYLDGSLFGNLEGIYEVPVNTDIFDAMASVLLLDRGNGVPVDATPPVFTEYYNGMTQLLPDGTTASLTKSPYTLRIDSDSGKYADIILGLNTMIAGWIGYDSTGALRVDPSQDDIVDTDKPVLWQFTPTEQQFLGATYTVRNSDVYNDIIVQGESLSEYGNTAARATNMDPASDTNIYGSIGKKTLRLSSSGYYTVRQCQDLACFRLKRYTALQKSVSIRSAQMFHLVENNLVTIARPDKPGNPIERHLVTGFTRPLSQTGEMTIQATSVNDFATATVTTVP